VEPARERDVRQTVHRLSRARAPRGSRPRGRLQRARRRKWSSGKRSHSGPPQPPLRRGREISRRKLEPLRHPRSPDQPRDRTRARITDPAVLQPQRRPQDGRCALAQIILRASNLVRNADRRGGRAISGVPAAVNGLRWIDSFVSNAGIGALSRQSPRKTKPMFSPMITSPKVASSFGTFRRPRDTIFTRYVCGPDFRAFSGSFV
jgi:hypothetical protein